MKISIGSDHGGFELKKQVIDFLSNKGYVLKDCGTYSLDSCDYPDFGYQVANDIKKGDCDFGIVICSTGIGMSIVANKVKGVRCALVSDLESARLTREHNNSNCLALGAKIIPQDLALQIVDTWITTEFTYGRHENRVNKIIKIEGENFL